MNSQLIYLTKGEKQFLEMYWKFMNASNNIFFFTSSCLLSAASFCIFNGQHGRIKLCEMACRVHKSEDQIKYLIYGTKVLTVCAVNYGVMASMVFNK